ncbi:hypothetical protein GDO86_007968 [Hymenochirus boettgeri]|uniref:Metalloendopeptidase OMA1, mitochondrial n=1 Tax=Hymenochirus boettgeri TaxID=247094 RepID=A0A8T2J3V6_9PIPI|nr:hypothetical protein GDO86_007968 [Hymenochirus boettgeri]
MIEEFKDIMLSKEDSRYQHVQRIVDLLISSNSDLPGVFETEWVVHVVENPDINACALPNGQIFVFTGLLEAALDAHQLSFILGHEMAHALLEHTAEMNSVSHFLDFFFLVSLVIIWAICPVDSLAIMGQWIQSTLKKACVDVRASSVFWKQMEVLGTLSKDTPIPEWLSTHPSHENRADHLDRLIPEAIKLRESCNCPALPFPDPREVFNLTAKQLLQAPENAITANK